MLSPKFYLENQILLDRESRKTSSHSAGIFMCTLVRGEDKGLWGSVKKQCGLAGCVG